VKYGVGRGYYGVGQLAPTPPKRSGGWIKVAVVVGVGAFIWYMWPRKDRDGIETAQPKPLLPEAPAPAPAPTVIEAPVAQPALSEAPTRPVLPAGQVYGFPSQQAYEDAVVASAKQLRDSGAQVVLAPHLQHLAPRLG
jgi:hypothetical protein